MSELLTHIEVRRFNVGDRVYCPRYSTGVYTLESRDKEMYPLCIRDVDTQRVLCSLTSSGKILPQLLTPIIYHATPENKVALEQLYGVEFEGPALGFAIELREHFENDGKSILCYVVGSKIPRFIDGYEASVGLFCCIHGEHWEVIRPATIQETKKHFWAMK